MLTILFLKSTARFNRNTSHNPVLRPGKVERPLLNRLYSDISLNIGSAILKTMNISPITNTVPPPQTSVSASGESGAGEESPISSRQNEKTASSDTEQQQRAIIAELAKRDREVRAHEQAHAAVGGVHAGAPSLTYERGPNGRLYATGGEVPIDSSPVPGDPQATLEKAIVVQRAALAPAQPSAADRRIAAQAAAIALQARVELAITSEKGTILDIQV